MTHVSASTTTPRRVLAALAIATAIGGIFFSPAAPAREEAHGTILIADQFNNRVIEIDRDTHRVLWHFGNGSDLPGPKSIVGVNDAERFNGFTLISDTGLPPSHPPLPGCADPVSGCQPRHVVFGRRVADLRGP